MVALTVVSRGLLKGPILRGARDGFLVEAARRRALPFGLRAIGWRVDVRFVSLSVRTALRVWPRGPSLSAALQGTNVTTGDPDLDERFLMWGSAPDLTRAVVEDARVRAALERVHRVAVLEEIALHPIGNLEVSAHAIEPDPTDPVRLIGAAVALARAFEDAADAHPVERRALDRHGVGGFSGAPVVIPSAP